MASQQAVEVMARTLPEGYHALRSCTTSVLGPSNRPVLLNVCGVVSDLQSPSPTRGSDWQLTFMLNDIEGASVRIKFFRPAENLLPNVKQNGDVVFLKQINLRLHNGVLVLLAQHCTEFVIFPRDSIAAPRYRDEYSGLDKPLKYSASKVDYRPNIHIQQYAITLRAHFKDRFPYGADGAQRGESVKLQSKDTADASITAQAQSTHRGLSVKEKFSLLTDMRIDGFNDLVGEVVKKWWNPGREITELYITDYTENKKLHNHEPDDYTSSQSKWPGPYGHRTLKVDLFQPHAYYAEQHIEPGMFVLLQNVRIKWSKGNELEGSIWRDERYPNKLGVTKLNQNDSRWQDLDRRRIDYRSSFEKKRFPDKNPPQGAESKTARKKRKKREREEQAVAALQDNSGGKTSISNEESPGDGESIAKRPRLADSQKVNPNITCLHTGPLSSFDEILDNPHRQHVSTTGSAYELPFVNAKHHCKLSVVDYYPHRLQNFVRQVQDKQKQNALKWEWYFWLVVRFGMEHNNEGVNEAQYLHVEVSGEEAETLLGILPVDLAGKPGKKTVKRLEEKVFHLWGDLAEKKDKFSHAHPQTKLDDDFSAMAHNIMPDNIPFKACLEEYGLMVEDELGEYWQRCFKLFGTRIET